MNQVRFIAALLAVLSSAAPGLAQAQAVSQKTIAEALFRDAKSLMDRAKYPEACAKFSESQRADPTLGTQLYLALCYEKQGKAASAWTEYAEAANQATRTNQTARAAFARTRVTELDKILSRVTLSIQSQNADGLEVRLDNNSVGTAALGTPVPLDPGQHQVTAKQPGKKAWSTTFTVPDGPSSLTIDIPVLEQEPASVRAASVEASTNTTAEAASGPSKPSEDTNSRRIVAWTIGGAGLMMFAGGAVFGLRASSKRDQASQECVDKLCTQAGLDAIDSANAAATLSTIGFGVGLAGLAAGAALAFWPSPKAANANATATVVPMIGPSGGAITLVSRF